MIKIAFCDDDMEVLHQMNELLDRYRVERNEDITYAAFQSPFELLTEIEKGICILYEVGNDYIALYQPDEQSYISADLYSIRFVEFLPEISQTNSRQQQQP